MGLSLKREFLREQQLDSFWRFVCERQRIWYRRFIEKRNPPWTEDPILRTVRFTNVYRELDPGTKFAVQNILEQPISIKDKIFNIMLYRLIGRLETFSEIGLQSLFDFDPPSLESKLKFIRDVERKPPFSNAYTVSSYTQMGSHDKIENVTRLFSRLRERFEELFNQIVNAQDAQDAFNAIRRSYGFGTFLSYQILVDLLYPLESNRGRAILPFSHDDWAIAGPGAQRGIHLLRRENTPVDQLAVMRWLRNNQRSEFERLDLDFPYLTDKPGGQIEISLSNIENCLCEFNKYVSVGTKGRARRRFDPPATQELTKWLTA